jgi:serine/threonine protein kinase/formylglycine-generating enzyme required for sulfatase activity
VRLQDPAHAETRPLADTTVLLELPSDALAILELPPALSRAERLTLVLADQRSRWLAGSPVESERYLVEMPELGEDRGARLAVVEGEVRARRAVGAVSTLADFRGRFPELHDELTVLFEAGGDRPETGACPSGGSNDPTAAYGVVGPDGVYSERTIHEFIGRYQILRIIGQGGFGLVYLARDELLDRPVAIKVPRLDRVTREEDVDAFLREARILAGLDHENIVPVYDVGRTRDGLCFVVSKWIDGESLTRNALGEGANPARIAVLVAAVADALAHAHQRGLVHRDVKPSNVLLDAATKPYLTDFGLALREEDFAQGAAVAGTPAYMSPEQARGEWHRVDARTDIFSLGIVLFELLSGGHPYGTGMPSTIMRRIAMGGPLPCLRVDDSIPPELERICLRALAPRAADRYGTARELAEELRLFAAEAEAQDESIVRRRAERPVGCPEPNATDDPTGSVAAAVIPKGLRAFGPEDAEFFVELLHGPRDRKGLPDSLRFWKTRIEAEASFPVGVIYGPSGCGKSSMVRAGLLPRLAPRVVAIYEGATRDLEPRLLARIRRLNPGISPDATLVEALAEVRRGTMRPHGSKLLIVLDQFEQWLHGRGGGPDDELVRALRQCDGDRLQALLIVRVDFWMAAGRFMRQLEVPVVEGENAAAVDLFPPSHARKVLAALGVAYGKVPAPPAEPGDEERTFIDRAIAMMTQDGTVSPVRLSLFVEMVKNRAWTAETLGDLGGLVGIGVRFLDETFVEPTAPPEHRLHRDAASRVLAALLPGAGADIKGHLRSHRDLLVAAGYADTPGRFDSLMRILDAETRLLTPMVPHDSDEAAESTTNRGSSGALIPQEARHYQLTHDYLVPSIREWLARQQKESRRGRAELMLTERAALWGARRERKQLPSLLEWGSIRILTQPGRWSETERAMMRSADRQHLARAGTWMVFLAAIVVGILAIRRQVDEDRNRQRAEGMVGRLLDASSPQVPAIIEDLEGYRAWADPLLRGAVLDSSTRRPARLHVRLALLPADPGQVDALVEAMLEVDPEAFVIIRDALLFRRDKLAPLLWQKVESSDTPPDMAFRAAVALARYSPADGRWAGRAETVVRQLLGQPSLLVPAWVELLRPVRLRLLPALVERLREGDDDNALVASIVADYAADKPDVLAETIADAGPGEFQVLLASRWTTGPQAAAALQSGFAGLLDDYSDEPNDLDAARIANTAIALVRLGRYDGIWPLLEAGPDPRIRSDLIDRMAILHCVPSILIDRLRVEPNPSSRAALWLSMGRFGPDQLPDARRSELTDEIIAAYRDDPDPGVHAATAWLLRTWGRADRVRLAEEAISAAGDVGRARAWSINSRGATMLRLAGREEFRMGSPREERWRKGHAVERVVRIRPFDIGMTEVTIGQFRAFLDERPDLQERYRGQMLLDPSLPVTEVCWYDAVAYCNWLSAQEGMPAREWCYQPNDEGKYADGMKIVADFHSRRGYRLPIEAEWEYACRAGTTTSRCFGDGDALLSRYAYYVANSSDRPSPVGSLLPNAFGLFDMHGNVFEWCQDRFSTEDEPVATEIEVVGHSEDRLVRGCGFMTHQRHVRSAARYKDLPGFRNNAGGFRLVRSRPIADR